MVGWTFWPEVTIKAWVIVLASASFVIEVVVLISSLVRPRYITAYRSAFCSSLRHSSNVRSSDVDISQKTQCWMQLSLCV